MAWLSQYLFVTLQTVVAFAYPRYYYGCLWQGYTWKVCCDRKVWGAKGNPECWAHGIGYSYERCCQLAQWNNHELALPLADRSLSIATAPRLRETVGQLCIYQGNRSAVWEFLWQTSYQLLRWFDCYADQPPQAWINQRFLVVGDPLGTAAIMAALNGAFVTLVHAFDNSGLIEHNLIENLPMNYWHRVRLCKLDLASGTLETSWLATLSTCEGLAALPPGDHSSGGSNVKYDIVVGVGSASNEDVRPLLDLVHAVSHSGTLVYLNIFRTAKSNEKFYTTLDTPWMAELKARFHMDGVWLDRGVTAYGESLLVLYRRNDGRSDKVYDPLKRIRHGTACRNHSLHWKRVAEGKRGTLKFFKSDCKKTYVLPTSRLPQEPDNSSRPLSSFVAGPKAADQAGRATPQSVGICVTGLERTLLSTPVVSTFHRHVTGALHWARYESEVMMSIIDSSKADGIRKRIEEAYRPVALKLLDAKALEPRCGKDFQVSHENRKVLLQWYGIGVCYGMVEEQEKKRGKQYTWLYRLRSDVVYFVDFLPETHLGINSTENVYVPSGGMSNWTNFKCMNDHMIFCPRHLCRPYFTLLEVFESPHCVAASKSKVPNPGPEASCENRTAIVPAGFDGPPTEDYCLSAIPQGFHEDNRDKWQWDAPKINKSSNDTLFFFYARKTTAQWYVVARYGGGLPCAPLQRAAHCCGLIREVDWAYSIARVKNRTIECQQRLSEAWHIAKRFENIRYMEACKELQTAWRAEEEPVREAIA
eukprot:TRINITY_DN41241_c0_g1_i3.p1 TRINITY_DN41241_c0_g1~~TRINITY_DN41241_c0_g1_i3.p1  ORF type:complete len:758 (-),score=117.89 TRINITY_DN41241_c0_g1_i3:234-2507(-)